MQHTFSAVHVYLPRLAPGQRIPAEEIERDHPVGVAEDGTGGVLAVVARDRRGEFRRQRVDGIWHTEMVQHEIDDMTADDEQRTAHVFRLVEVTGGRLVQTACSMQTGLDDRPEPPLGKRKLRHGDRGAVAEVVTDLADAAGALN